MKILGINFEQHDSGAALVIDGEIVAAVNEERFSRKKIDNSAPVESIMFCLQQAGIKPKDLDLVVLSGFPPLKKLLYFGSYYRKVAWLTGLRSLFFFMFSSSGDFFFKTGVQSLFINLAAMTGLPSFYYIFVKKLNQVKQILAGFSHQYKWVDHHIGHLSSAIYTSGCNAGLAVIIEGTDWQHSMVIDQFEGNRVKRICATPWPHSAGYFYELITMLLGFNLYVHAGKITGLAAYGEADKALSVVKQLMWVEGMELRVSPLVFTLRNEYVKLKKIPSLLSKYSKEDLAAAFQAHLEDCIIEIVRTAVKRTGEKNIVLAGGVCANVKLNQKIYEIEGVESIFVHPAMSDAGQALGVALWESAKLGDITKPFTLKNVFLGPEYSEDVIERELKKAKLYFFKPDKNYQHIAELLAENQVVARFTGRVEYGPRALGNRSILYPAIEPTVNDWLNKRMNRTEFMPFAPVCLMEDAEKLYINIDGAKNTARFMTITFNCTEKMQKDCPAVVHIDGTARPQLVSAEDNPELYSIIDEYKKITGISAIINTSFNMHGEPIVLTPADAVKSFLQGNLDYLAIGPYIVPHPERKKSGEE